MTDVTNQPRRDVLRWGPGSAMSHAGQAVADVRAEAVDRRQGKVFDRQLWICNKRRQVYGQGDHFRVIRALSFVKGGVRTAAPDHREVIALTSVNLTAENAIEGRSKLFIVAAIQTDSIVRAEPIQISPNFASVNFLRTAIGGQRTQRINGAQARRDMRVMAIGRIVRINGLRMRISENLIQQTPRSVVLWIFELRAGKSELDNHGIAAELSRLPLLGPPRLAQIRPAPDASRAVGQDHAGKFPSALSALLDAVESHEFKIIGVRTDPEAGGRTQCIPPIPTPGNKDIRRLLEQIRHRANVAPPAVASISTFALAAPDR